MGLLGTVLRIWGEWFAPIHELGHVIFGWLSFNPTFIQKWDQSGSVRTGFMMSLGGYLFEIIVGAALAYMLRKHKWIYPVAMIQVASALYATRYRSDLAGSRVAEAIWYLSGFVAFMVILISAIKAGEERDERTKRDNIERTRRLLARQGKHRQEVHGLGGKSYTRHETVEERPSGPVPRGVNGQP